MGLQQFFMKLLGTSQPPVVHAYEGLAHFEDQTGYYTVRGKEFNQIYLIWSRDKVFPIDKVKALAPDAFVANLNNRSGYVREFCLRALAVHDWLEAFKPVVLRLNDYVPINRELALQLVQKWLAELPVTTVVDALPELSALEEQSRSNHATVQQAVQNRLGTEDGQSALIAGTSHSHAKVRSVCWKLCLQTFAWTGSQRIEAAMRCGDPAIARSVEQDVFLLADEELMVWFKKIHQVRAMPLRRAFLVAARPRGLVEAPKLIACALWDDSLSIRWLARFWSKDTPEFLLQQYLQVLDGPCAARRKCYAFEGLAVLKTTGALEACKNALDDENLAIRKAALIAVCGIDPENLSVYIPDALQDEDLAVVRQAFRLLAVSGLPLPIDALQKVANTRHDELPFFVLMLQCARQLSMWPAMHLATLTSMATPALKPQLQTHIDNFLSGLALTEVYVEPTQKQWQAICSWLPTDKLSPQSSLRYVMDVYAKRMNK
jgi:HEAT repeat protein